MDECLIQERERNQVATYSPLPLSSPPTGSEWNGMKEEHGAAAGRQHIIIDLNLNYSSPILTYKQALFFHSLHTKLPTSLLLCLGPQV